MLNANSVDWKILHWCCVGSTLYGYNYTQNILLKCDYKPDAHKVFEQLSSKENPNFHLLLV